LITIEKVEAENFYSLGKVTFELHNGVYLVYGENRDSSSEEFVVSNGAGKTALFNAVYQGLFNRNAKDPKGTVTTVNNVYTGKPYRIKLWLKMGRDDIFIDNDRNKNKITIVKNGEDITPKGIVNQLMLIKNMLGFDGPTFMSLTFLNQMSLDSIIDISSKDNVVYQFFNIEQLKQLEKSIKASIKELKEERHILIVKKASAEKSIKMTETLPEVDEEDLLHQKLVLNDALLELDKSPLAKGISVLEKQVAELKVSLASIKHEGESIKSNISFMRGMIDKFSSGECPVCGSDVTGKAASLQGPLDKANENLKEIKKRYDAIKDELRSKETELIKASNKFSDQKTKILNKINAINSKIEAAKMARKAAQQLLENREELESEIKEADKRLFEIDKLLDYLGEVLQLIKSGAIVNEYLEKYVLLLGANIKRLEGYSSFPFSIKVFADKGKLNYRFVDKGKIKTFTQLSSGERTRASLIILLATLSTIEQLTKTKLNFLVLDELLGVLDEDGVEFLKIIINELREEKAIFIITHHGEIEEDFADETILVVKQNDISSIKTKGE